MQTTHDPVHFKSGYLPVNGIQMYYEIHGSGKPLVLIHGGGSTISTSFGRILPLLAKTHQVIAVELQAHGHTGDRDAPESFDQDADDVAELLKQLHISKANVMGFSNGGSTTLKIAIRHPHLVNKLIAVSAVYKRDGMPPGFWGFMEKGTIADLPQVYKDVFLSIQPDQEKLLNMYQKDRERMLTFKDWKTEDIQSIQAPSLIIGSDRDAVRPEHAMEIAGLVPNGRFAIFPGGHGEFMGEAMAPNPESKAPEATVMILNEFLNDASKNENN